jgi:predicted unusual protein kinase regulating ubiquinone biosynthesis (AarF/ABC1/UbiB family)
VLTSLFAEGDELEVATRYPEAERRRAIETLFRFVYRSILVGGLFNADPHPGNYLFRRDGRIVFLDFGCVQELPHDVVVESRACHRAAVQRDEEGFTAAARRLVRTRGGAYEEDFVTYLRTTLDPVFRSPFRITRAFARGLVSGLYELKQRAFARGSGFVPLPEGTVLLNRLQVGFYSVLARLDAEVDYAAIERGFLAEPHRVT